MPEGELKIREEQERPDRMSGLVRVAGVPPEEEIKILKDVKENIFDKQKLYGPEREKTPEEVEIIKGILAHLPEFVEKYGGQPVPLRPEHIHIFEYGDLSEVQKEKLKTIRGQYEHSSQLVAVVTDAEEENNLTFALRTIHELMHFSAFQSAEIVDRENKKIARYNRIEGFLIKTREDGQGQLYFNDWNEAMAEELSIRFDNEFFDSIEPLSKSLADRAMVQNGFMKRHPDFSEGEVRRKIANCTNIQMKHGPDAGKWRCTIEAYRYSEERKKMNAIIKGIYEKNSEKFVSIEEVFEIFAVAYFTGKMLPVARLIEGTYGKGSFRRLGRETKAEKVKK